MRAFTAYLNKMQRLTASLLLRALAHGHMTFFEWAIAELSGVPHHRTWLMIHDAGELGLKAIYERAGFRRAAAAFRAGSTPSIPSNSMGPNGIASASSNG